MPPWLFHATCDMPMMTCVTVYVTGVSVGTAVAVGAVGAGVAERGPGIIVGARRRKMEPEGAAVGPVAL